MQDIQALSNVSTSDFLKGKSNASEGSGFADVLKQSLNEVNETQKTADKAMSDLATGSVKDLHQAALAIDKAEINMKLMLEIRNKALNAYKEISRTQI